jgi:NADH dehydrogenase (ubiquinone) Fe-S protein 7
MKPSTALLTYRAGSSAFISNSSAKPAAPEMMKPGLVKGGPPPPPPMKSITGKDRREVPLPSQEGKKGAMQYAL